MMKMFLKLGIKWIFIHLIKGVYKKPTRKHHVHSVTSEYSLKVRTRRNAHHNHFYCTAGIRKMKYIRIRKEETKVSLFSDDISYSHRKSMRTCKLLGMRVQ